jgi:hypothetical protein
MATTTPIAISATATVVAAKAGYCVRVYSYVLSFSGAVNAKFQSHVGPTDLTGLIYSSGVTGYAVSPSLGIDVHRGQFQSLPGEALDINLSASVATGGYLVWEYVAS